jgi:hypothetical protein
MQERSHIAAAVAAIMFVSCPAGLALAQNAPASGTDTATPPATSAPAASAPAATTPAPAAAPAETTPAPAATTAAPAPAATTSAPATSSSTATTKDSSATPTKETKKKKRMTRQQEIDHSIATGTVPSRYRSSVPKEYQKYIPFDKK